ncbi:Catechol O-methyltransferase [Phytophthora palmivora]|uniref:catechol O-methyltransferase n=2 Tax=Phytophthora palmivora TaxID=4796 RepID=A0A2P4YT86_9STRA|nr:Catechol O-methyltransferase [Phytophthora palmivora]
MMNVGDVKGELLDQEISKVKPKILVELGGLFGYSAIRLASRMRDLSGPSVHVYSFEISPNLTSMQSFLGTVLLKIWRSREVFQMVEFAGLSDLVTIFVGTFGDNHTKLKELGVGHVDVFFLDHDKKCYKSDLEIIEQSGLLRSGSVVMADNVVVAKITDYLEYVRGHPNFKSVMYDSYLEYSDIKDALEVSTYMV